MTQTFEIDRLQVRIKNLLVPAGTFESEVLDVGTVRELDNSLPESAHPFYTPYKI